MRNKRKRNGGGYNNFFTRLFKEFCDSSTDHSGQFTPVEKSCSNIRCESKRASELGLVLRYVYSWNTIEGGTLVVQAPDSSSLIEGLQVVGGVTASN